MSNLTAAWGFVMLCVGARNTLYSGRTAPSERFCHALVVFGADETTREGVCMSVHMFLTSAPPYARRKANGGPHKLVQEYDMSTSISTVAFHGANLTFINRGGKAYVALKPICDSIGLDWSAQAQKIKRDPVLNSTVVITTMVAEDGKTREMICLPLGMLNGWLFGVKASRVRPELREKLIKYQLECYDVLNAYWSGKTVSRQPEFSRMNLEALCNHMLFLEGWWHQYGPAMSKFNERIAASLHDHFIDGAFVAAGFVNIFKLDVVSSKYAMNYPFHKSYQEQQQYHLTHSRT